MDKQLLKHLKFGNKVATLARGIRKESQFYVSIPALSSIKTISFITSTPSMNHILPNLTLPTFRTLKAIRMCLEIRQCLMHFVLCIEDERPVLNDLLVEWETCY
jgi:hypothetical protein